MIWYTTTANADRQTGEIIPQELIDNGTYIRTSKKITYKIHSNNTLYGTRTITYGCERNRQTNLFDQQTIDRKK